MELTIEQINQLKQKGLDDTKISALAQAKGYTLPKTQTAQTKTLSEQQISDLKSKGLDDNKIQALAQAKGYELPKKEGLISSIFRGITAPVVSSLVRPVQLGAELLGASAEDVNKATASALPYYAKDGYLNVPQTGADVLKDIGRGAETISLGIGGGGAVSTVKTGLKGAVIAGAKEGAIIGAKSGGLLGFGQALQEAEVQPSDVAMKTLFGAATGGAFGGAIGAMTPIVVKGVNATKRFTDVNQINTELNKLNTEVFKPTAKQAEKFSRQGKDPIKTYTEIFGTDVPSVGKDNKFTNESINDFVERVNDVYTPAAEGFNTILRNSPEVNSLSKARNDAIKNLDMFGLTPAMKEKAISQIDNNFDAIRKEAIKKGVLQGDNIPVAYTDNLKDMFWKQTKNFGTEDATIANSVNSSIGHGFKDAIENSIKDTSVKNYNKKLGDLIVLRDFLDTKRGALSGTGGKMTRLMARVAGTVAGSPGGTVGSIMGNLTGDKLAQIMIDPSMQPYRWLINKKLAQLPRAEVLKLEEEANAVLQQMFKRRMETLALPAPATEMIAGKITPVIKSQTKPIILGGETTFEKQAQRVSNQPLNTSQSIEPITKATTNVTNNPIPKSITPTKEVSSKIPDKLFHGGANIEDIKLGKSNFQKTFYMSENADYAKSYGGKNSILNEVSIDKNAKLADLRNPNKSIIEAIKEKISAKPTGKIIKIQKPDGTFVEVPEVKGGKNNAVHSTNQIIDGIKNGKAYFAEMPEVKSALKELGYDGMITQESKYGANYGVWNNDVLKLSPKPKVSSLISEAKKYKSAEEFVKAQGTPVYRGGAISDTVQSKGNLGSGVYVTTNKQQATNFSRETGILNEIILPKGKFVNRGEQITSKQVSELNKQLKLNLDQSDIIKQDFIDFYEGMVTPLLEDGAITQAKLGEIMKSVTGKIGITDDYYGSRQYLIFNPKAIKTKSQLEQIWKQANKK